MIHHAGAVTTPTGRNANLGHLKVSQSLQSFVGRIADLLEGEAAAAFVLLRRIELIGRPFGSAGFVAEIEKRLGRALALVKRGRKPRNQAAAADQ
jgi:hypothetical protein